MPIICEQKSDRSVTHSRNISNNKLYIYPESWHVWKRGASQGEWAIGYNGISTHNLFRLVLLALRFSFLNVLFASVTFWLRSLQLFIMSANDEWRLMYLYQWTTFPSLFIAFHCMILFIHLFHMKRSIATQHRHNYIIALIQRQFIDNDFDLYSSSFYLCACRNINRSN